MRSKARDRKGDAEGMRIIIEAEPKEIADLLLAADRQGADVNKILTSLEDVIEQSLKSSRLQDSSFLEKQ